MHAKRLIITSVVIVCFQVCKCCKFEHVSNCKSCDHLILLCVVLYAKILIINVIIKYMHGYKCCGLCCKCCGVKKMHNFSVQQWPHGLIHARVSGHVLAFWSTTREHGQNTRPCSALSQNFEKLILSSFWVFHTLDAYWTIF